PKEHLLPHREGPWTATDGDGKDRVSVHAHLFRRLLAPELKVPVKEGDALFDHVVPLFQAIKTACGDERRHRPLGDVALWDPLEEVLKAFVRPVLDDGPCRLLADAPHGGKPPADGASFRLKAHIRQVD